MEARCLDAFRNGNKEEALRLLKKVKDPRKLKDSGDSTPLHYAAAKGWTDVVELLVSKYECDVNCVDFGNWTPVYEASFTGHLDVVECLYNTGKCDLSIKTNKNETPLSIACHKGHHEIIEFITNVVLATSTLTCK